MPRRKLHGETQGRRKKKRTRLLKRKGSITRSETTQEPAPFEKKPHPEREDLEFLEAMREMDVRRAPWGREAPIRRRNAERVRFLAEDEERALFMERMEHLDVQPLQPGNPPAGEKSQTPSYRSGDGELSHQRGCGQEDSGRSGQHHSTADAPPSDFSTTFPPVSETAPLDRQTPQTKGPTMAKRTAMAKNDEPRSPLEITRFETQPPSAEDAEPAAMEALMAGEDFDPSLKFAGAVTPPPRGRDEAKRRFSDDLEPDEELDLHGKTQEESIRMVQNFLLVSHRQKLRHVLIITGKGHNSGQEGPVLGRAVLQWLERNGDRYVRNFIQAPPRMGGAGAIWITLR